MVRTELLEAMKTRWNTHALGYDESAAHGVHDPLEIGQWTAFLSWLGPAPLSVLDVGSGTGFVALVLARMGHRVTAVDFSTEMLGRARAKAQHAGRQIIFVETETEALPFEDGHFDAVVSRHVLWTLPQPLQALREWFRVLKPGGRALADYSPRRPGTSGPHYIVEIEQLLPLNREARASEVLALFEEAGFTALEVQSIPRAPGRSRETYLFRGSKPGDLSE